jgi:hypothetical protein|tara:strand:+ start:40 stop:318 length:279 start_codon:yes stop_codon:yes gene_type:complete
MKKLMYLLVAGTMFVFTACNCGADDAAVTEETAVEEVVAEDAAVEEVVEAVGCQVEGGTCLEDHSCCAPAVDATEEVVEEGHDHGAEGHSHE